MDYKASSKVNGKWHTFGRVKEGKYGPQLSFKNTQEFKDFVNSGGEWLNFALFEDSGEKKPIVAKKTSPAAPLLDDEIPF